MNNSAKLAIILFGPPGSGKGTQANLLADKIGLYQFDMGAFLRSILFDPKNQNRKDIQANRKHYESGELCETAWVEKVVHEKIKRVSKLGQSVVFSGNPRNIEEAFGKNGNSGLMALLEKEYGKKNIHIFALEIPEAESVKRNMKRTICSVCRIGILGTAKLKSCPICEGKLEHRKDDNKEAIKTRLRVYKSQTEPVLDGMKKRKLNLIILNGTPAPYKIHQQILGYFQ